LKLCRSLTPTGGPNERFVGVKLLQNTIMKKNLTYFYDKEADVFYFSSGNPRASDETVEAGNDVLLRVDSKTKHVRGFTLINASKRSVKGRGTSLPFSFSQISKV